MKKLILLFIFVTFFHSCKKNDDVQSDDIQQEIKNNPLVGQWTVNSAQKPPSIINNINTENSISSAEFCKIHSIIFFED